MFASRNRNQANQSERRKPARGDSPLGKKTAPQHNPLWQSLATRSGVLQPKLTIGQADDQYEREADQVADRVMRMPAPRSSGHGPAISPVTAHQAQRKCAECEEEEEVGTLQRKGSSGAEAPATAPPTVDQTLSSPGQPLDPATRAYFEPRFGHDFSAVRIHTDTHAAESARAINARGYTAGNQIAFAAGQHSPETSEGRRLIAHELMHVVQQRQSNAPLLQLEPDPPRSLESPGESGADARGEVPLLAGLDIERVVLEHPQFLLDRILPKIMLQYTREEFARTARDEEGATKPAYAFGMLIYRRASNDTYDGNHCTDLVFNSAWLAGYDVPTQKELFPNKRGLLPTHEVFVNLEKLEGLGFIEIVVQPNDRFHGSAPEQVRDIRQGDVMLWDRQLQDPEPYAWLGHTAVIEWMDPGRTPAAGKGVYPMMTTGEQKTPVPEYHFPLEGGLDSPTRSQEPIGMPTLDVIEAGSHVAREERELWPSDRYSAVYRFAKLDGERIVKMYREDPVYRSHFNDAWSPSTVEDPQM
jgi:hypothetical protein